MIFTLKVKMKLEKAKLLHNGSGRLKRKDSRRERSCKTFLVKLRIGMNEFWYTKYQVRMAQMMASSQAAPKWCLLADDLKHLTRTPDQTHAAFSPNSSFWVELFNRARPLILQLSQGKMEKDFYPKCQGTSKDLGSVGGERMKCTETEGEAGSSSPLQTMASWPPSQRHMDFCLGTSGLYSWSNEQTLWGS